MNRVFNLTLLLVSLSAFYSCSDSSSADTGNERKIGKGNRIYGGTLKLNESDPFSKIVYPPKVVDASTIFLLSQIYEGLVRFDRKDLSIRPSLAEKWDIDSSGKVYTFYLRKGVKFHNDPCFPGGKGREVKSSDFKYSYELFCNNEPLNESFGTTFKDIVLGADEYYNRSINGKSVTEVEGFKVIDDYTFQIRLIEPRSSFLNILACASLVVIPKESVEKYGERTKVGTGPFMLKESNSEQNFFLVRNPTYYGLDSLGNQLPFIDTIYITHFQGKKEELDAFLAHKQDMVLALPSENVKQLTSTNITDFSGHPPKYVLDRKPEMTTQYFEFNVSRAPFNNKKVRQAFAYAINKEKIVEEVLKDEVYESGIYGITPPSFEGYDISRLKGCEYNPEKAKKLLAEAGYPGGKNFPHIKLEVNSAAKHQQVAFSVYEQLKTNLGIDLTVEVTSLVKKIEHNTTGQYDMSRSGWLADYPSPENFLLLFYGKTVPDSIHKASFPNVTRYQNPEFDKLYEMGKRAKTREKSYAFFLKAEQIVLDDVPFIPLWYGESYSIVQANVKNFYSNPIRYRDFREVYLEDVKAENKKEEKPKQ